MSSLRAAVHVAKPIPLVGSSGKPLGVWSPISCTLVYSASEALLVDTPISIDQTKLLVEWIKRIAPGRKLANIYITHGHPDHWLGSPILLQEFLEAKVLATKGTLAHMHESVSEASFAASYDTWFPGQVAKPFVFAEPLDASNSFHIDGRWECRAVEVGHSDTHDSTVLWVPELKLAVCGDVIYGQVHQMLAFANTAEKREEWRQAIATVEKLKPELVVAGHKQAEELDGAFHLANTRKYIDDFEACLRDGAESVEALFKAMMALYPDRFNPGALLRGCAAAFASDKPSL